MDSADPIFEPYPKPDEAPPKMAESRFLEGRSEFGKVLARHAMPWGICWSYTLLGRIYEKGFSQSCGRGRVSKACVLFGGPRGRQLCTYAMLNRTQN